MNVEMSSLGRLHPFLCRSLSCLTENLSREINWEYNGKKTSLGHSSLHYLRCFFFRFVTPKGSSARTIAEMAKRS